MTENNRNNSCDTKSVGKKPETNQLRQFIIAMGVLLILIICIAVQFGTNQDGFVKGLDSEAENYGFHDAKVISLYMIEGFVLGYVLQRAFFGFTSAFTKPLKFHDFSTSKAVLVLLLVSTFAITFAQVGINYAAGEQVPNQWHTGDQLRGYDYYLIRGNAISFSLILGGLLFGVGMTYASGCASGTLSHWAEGNARGLFVIIGFMIGGFVGIIFKEAMTNQNSWMGKGPYISFWDAMGVVGGMIFNLFLISMVYVFILYLEKKWGNKDKIKKQKDFVKIQDDMYEQFRPRFIKNEKLSRTYYSLFTRNYTIMTGALVIAVIGVSIYTATGTFGISTTYAMWPTYAVSGIFGDVEKATYGTGIVVDGTLTLGLSPEQILMVNSGWYGFWRDGESWQDIMIIFGALFSILMQGKFKFKSNNLSVKRASIFLMGGILMGFSTRIGGGCNIGALYDPIITASLSGYVFGIGMMGGAFIAYQSFKIIDPPSMTD